MGNIMLCASLVLGALADFVVGLKDLPDPHRDNFRLIVLGDSFASPTMARIPTALMARSPEGRIRAWRVPAKLNAAPLRLLDTGPEVFHLNDPLEQGCYGFETDRCGVHLGLPVTRPMDVADVDEITVRLEYANTLPTPPSPDFNGDGIVNYEDLLILLASWDQSDVEGYDLNGDGQVNYVDLLVLLSAWTI